MMTECNTIQRVLPISRARRELTSILRRSESVWLTKCGVLMAELVPVGDRLLEQARAGTQRASAAMERALELVAASNQRIEALERSRGQPADDEQERAQAEDGTAAVSQQVQAAERGADIGRPLLRILRERMAREPEFVLALLSEVQDLIRDGDVATASLLLRDMGRDIGAELLESIREMRSGPFKQAALPTGFALYRCVDLSVLGDLSSADLELGRLYVGKADKDGWIRVEDASGEHYLYPTNCFELIKSLSSSVRDMVESRRIHEAHWSLVYAALLDRYNELPPLIEQMGWDQPTAIRWSCTPRFDGGTKSPAELFEDGRGEEVLASLRRSISGVYI